MPLYLGWTVVTMPTTPSPVSVEFTRTDIVGVSISPFTGQQQTQDWNASLHELAVTMPSMNATNGALWRDFLIAMKGQANVCQWTDTAVLGLTPSSASGYWRLKANSWKWGVKAGLIYGMSFEFREAK